MPRVRGVDHSLAFLRDPYRFISRQCRELGSDVVLMRLMLQPVICLSGPEAAALFYDKTKFRRAGAAPEPVRSTLFGKGGVQVLDGRQHLERKSFFVGVTGPASTAALLAAAQEAWSEMLPAWSRAPRLVLYREMQQWLGRTVLRWAGVPVPSREAPSRISQLAALFDHAASGVAAHLHARHARARLESWLAGLVREHRATGSVFATGSPAALSAGLRQGSDLLPERIAAVELLNLLRPTIAVSVFIVQGVHALEREPRWRAALAGGAARETEAFVQEVRRFYPFFPAVAARTCHSFTWRGLHFPAGLRAMLDLYGTNHDERAWPSADEFRPERFMAASPESPFSFVPQGGGRAHDHHRCPGEGFTIALMKFALHRLAASHFKLPEQRLDIALDRMPAVPRDGLVISGLASRSEILSEAG